MANNHFLTISAFVVDAAQVVADTPSGQKIVDSIPSDPNMAMRIQSMRKSADEMTGHPAEPSDVLELLAATLT